MKNPKFDISNIDFRKLNYSNCTEVLEYIKIFWNIPASFNDGYFTKRSPVFLENWADNAIEKENESDTFSGIALLENRIIGIHILRKFEEYEQVGVHIAGLWVDEQFRNQGIARKLKEMGESWAISIGADFINTNIHPTNDRILKINESIGFVTHKINMRKKLKKAVIK